MPPTKARSRIFPRWMVAAAAIVAVGWLLYLLRGALTPIFFAFLIAYMLDPVVDRFEARGYSRAVGIGVMLTVVLGGLGVLMTLALPGIVRDLVAFFMDLPHKGRELLTLVEPWLDAVGIPVPHSLDEALTEFQLDVGELAKKAALPAGEILLWLWQRLGRLMGALVGLLMVPVFAAYLLYDFDRIIGGVRDLVPGRYRDLVVDVARDVDGILGEFIRGQLIVMLILAALYSLAYLVLGVRLAVLIGVIAGLISFIPYVGGGVALVMAVAMTLIYWTGWGQLIGVVVAYTIIQVLEGFVITPRVVGEKVGLSAVWVLFALLVGGEVFGFMGVLLALPAAAVIKIFVGRGLDWYRASEFFEGDEPPVETIDPPSASEEAEVGAGPLDEVEDEVDDPLDALADPDEVEDKAPESESESESESASPDEVDDDVPDADRTAAPKEVEDEAPDGMAEPELDVAEPTDK